MSERLVFESWQMLFPAVGFCLFVGIFLWVVVRAWRMKKTSLHHLEQLPLEGESHVSVSHVRSDQP